MKKIITKLIELFYPSELDRMNAVRNACESAAAAHLESFRQELLLAAGKTLYEASHNNSESDCIQAVERLVKLAAGTKSAASELNISEEEVIDEIRSIPMLEEKIEKFKSLSEKGAKKRNELISERKQKIKEDLEEIEQTYQHDREELNEELKKLNEEHVEAAQEEAVVKQEIINDEQK